MSPVQVSARLFYLAGSAVFFAGALYRGSPLAALGGALFVVGSLLLLVPVVKERRRQRASQQRAGDGGR